MTHVAILGLGGVGGFIGANLVHYYKGKDDIKFTFIARGFHADCIKKAGLRLESATKSITVNPDVVSDNVDIISPIDILIFCTKAYSLENAIKSIASKLHNNTIILPFLNGIDHSQRIKELVPHCKVLNACVYLVSKIKEPGVIEQKGSFYKYSFGSDELSKDSLLSLEKLLNVNDININYDSNILQTIWEKFLFISPLASTTALYKANRGEIFDNPAHFETFRNLLKELINIANFQKIPLSANIFEKTIEKSGAMPPESFTSMYYDYHFGNQSEIETLVGYPYRFAKQNALPYETYEDVYNKLNAKYL